MGCVHAISRRYRNYHRRERPKRIMPPKRGREFPASSGCMAGIPIRHVALRRVARARRQVPSTTAEPPRPPASSARTQVHCAAAYAGREARMGGGSISSRGVRCWRGMAGGPETRGKLYETTTQDRVRSARVSGVRFAGPALKPVRPRGAVLHQM